MGINAIKEWLSSHITGLLIVMGGFFVSFFVIYVAKIRMEILKAWKAHRAEYILQFFVFAIISAIVGGVLLWGITSSLKPRTDVSVTCEISTNPVPNYALTIDFENKADFAAKQFTVIVYNIRRKGWLTTGVVTEHCKRVVDNSTTPSRFKMHCEMIPPKSQFGFTIYSDLNDKILSSNKILMKWWGETTRYEEKYVTCKRNL